MSWGLVEWFHLPSKPEALSSNPSNVRGRDREGAKKERRKEGRKELNLHKTSSALCMKCY
jgi:hypothetical protein